MSFLHTLIAQEARDFEDREKLIKEQYEADLQISAAQRIQKVRTYLAWEAGNLIMRCRDRNPKIARLDMAQWVNGKTLLGTYVINGRNTDRRKQTHRLIKELKKLCGGERQLELEWARALDYRFPIKSKSYKWSTKIVVGSDAMYDVQFKQTRIRKPAVAPEETS